MVENVNDFLSIGFLLILLIIIVFYGLRSLGRVHTQRMIREEKRYYQDFDVEEEQEED